MKDSIDDIVVVATIAIYSGESWASEGAEGSQVIPGAQDKVCSWLVNVRGPWKGVGITVNAIETTCNMSDFRFLV